VGKVDPSLEEKQIHGAVASSSYYATNAGVDVLKSGGNAIDAFVAMQAMLTLKEPGSSGIGGGLFIVYYHNSEDKVYTLDGREEAPKATIEGKLISPRGGGSVGIPGTVAAIKEIHSRFGTKSIAELFQPTIDQAKEGFILDEFVSGQLVTKNKTNTLYSSTRELFYDSMGNALPPGTKIINNDLARTFEILVEKGLDDFYTGEIAQSIINAIQNDPYTPGVMTMEDLKNYLPVYREPLWITYKGYQMV